MWEAYTPRLKSPATISAPAYWFIFHNDQLLLNQAESYRLPLGYDSHEFGVSLKSKHYLGTYQQQHCFAIETIHSQSSTPNFEFVPLREAHQFIGEALFTLASRAKQILSWDKYNQFCRQCATKLLPKENERAKICPKCKLLVYPELNPAIAVLIYQPDKILLARSKRFNLNMYSILAGFIEPGESAEAALHREVQEEVGLSVKNLRYFASQSWPFPHTFMLGYTAEYQSGYITIDKQELEDAQWFPIDDLPTLPSKASISRQLIDMHIKQHQLLKKLYIRPLAIDEIPPWELLLLADPVRSNINEYLSHGRCFIALLEQEIIGAYVLLQKNKTDFEIMNIAVKPELQNHGIGRQLLIHACKQAKQANGEIIWIGTANSSTTQLKLYQKNGFVIDHLQKGFFTANYPKAIIENGIQATDKLVLKKKL